MSAASQPTHATESVADRKKSRELAEARQSGTVAPEVDVKTGVMINPHNPEFITKRPWYLGGGEEGPSLDHQADQRLESERVGLSLASAEALLQQERERLKEKQLKGKFEVGMWVEALKNGKLPYQICQIVKTSKKGTEFDIKFDDGSIERKVKLKPGGKPRIRITKTGSRAHEVDADQHGKETYDSKRDKYHGFDGGAHMKRLQEKFNKREELRQQFRSQKEESKDKNSKEKGSSDDSDFDDSDVEEDDSDDEFAQRDEDAKTFQSRLARQGGVGGAQMKVTARNLRIREDTAKYLRNLDVNSAYYDPKSRSMRDNPNPQIAAEDSQFAGDNFARISGDAVGLAETQLFAWDAAEKGVAAIHPQANPSEAEILKKREKSKLTDEKSKQRKAVLEKYGGTEYLDGTDGLATGKTGATKDTATLAAERKVRFGVSLAQEEYTRDGRLIKGGVAVKREALPSKYHEDVFANGHTTVWGSYFHRGAFCWGYADDHSLIRNSYCTGENGRKVNDEANEMKYGTGVAGSAALAQAREMLKAIPAAERKAAENSRIAASKLYGEADQSASFDKKKIDAALRKVDKDRSESEKKRKYNSIDAHAEVTEEEMEAYRIRKDLRSDPMAKIKSDDVLEYE
jgi:pre-mRNA-processing factor SLU7